MINKQEIVGLLIGLLVVMFVTWITLPAEKALETNAGCIEFCKDKTKRGESEIRIYSTFTYIKAMSICYEKCIEEKDDTKH